MYATVWYQPRHVDIGVVLQFQEYFETAENIKDPRAFRPLFGKGEGFRKGLGAAAAGLGTNI